MTARPKLLGHAPVLLLEGGPLGYTPGAGGALTGPESALSSLPACPCHRGDVLPGHTFRKHKHDAVCGKPARPHDGRLLRCTSGHVFAGTPREHEQARGALAAAERRAPHVQAERATTRERLRAEVEREAEIDRLTGEQMADHDEDRTR